MRVFVTAGEPSGDRLGASLMRGLRAQAGEEVSFDGVGGPLMEAEGLRSIFSMDEISIMGIVEILSNYRALKARIRETAQAVIDARPDVLVTVDLPEFSLRVAKIVRERAPDIRIVHYVAPTVWAWRPKRAEKMAAHVDQVLALLPFEPPYMEAAGIRCDFVGHPVAREPVASAAEVARFRLTHGLGEAPVALVLPGSRRSEVARLGPVFGRTLERVHEARPDLRFVVPAAPAVAGEVQQMAESWPGRAVVIDPRDLGDAALGEKRAAFGAADVALAASGTVSLELAAAGTPMVVAYDMGWLSRQIIGRMLLTDTVTLVNLVSETRAVPEFIGAKCRPEAIAPALLSVLEAPQEQMRALETTMKRLGRDGPSMADRAAAAVLDGLGRG